MNNPLTIPIRADLFGLDCTILCEIDHAPAERDRDFYDPGYWHCTKAMLGPVDLTPGLAAEQLEALAEAAWEQVNREAA